MSSADWMQWAIDQSMEDNEVNYKIVARILATKCRDLIDEVTKREDYITDYMDVDNKCKLRSEDNDYELKILAKYDDIQDHNFWLGNIPFLKFHPDWNVSIVPPFGWAMIRFMVRHNDKTVSAYLDCHNRLGVMDGVEGPYWEIYEGKNCRTKRYRINDTEELISGIAEFLS